MWITRVTCINCFQIITKYFLTSIIILVWVHWKMVYQGFGPNLGKSRAMIILVLTNFKASCIFWGSWGKSKNGSSLKPICHIKLSFSKSLIHNESFSDYEFVFNDFIGNFKNVLLIFGTLSLLIDGFIDLSHFMRFFSHHFQFLRNEAIITESK